MPRRFPPHSRSRVLLAALAALVAAGCYTSVPAPRADRAPAYTRSAAHHRAFASADALAAYLRADAPSGPLLSARRGGPAPAYPENALATFERTLRFAPALLQADVRRAADGTLILLHDATLDRTTTGTGPVALRTLPELRALLLRDATGTTTPFRIPTLAEALAWAEGRAVLVLEAGEDVPPEALVEAIRAAGAENRVVVAAPTSMALLHYHRLAPDLVYAATVETPADAEALFTSAVDPDRLIAFVGAGEIQRDVVAALRREGVRAGLGTFGTVDDRAARAGAEVYLPLLEAGAGILVTDDVVRAARAIALFTKAR